MYIYSLFISNLTFKNYTIYFKWIQIKLNYHESVFPLANKLHSNLEYVIKWIYIELIHEIFNFSKNKFIKNVNSHFMTFLLNPFTKIGLLILEREGGRKTLMWGRNIDVRENHRTCPNQGSNLQSRCVPWPGIIKSATFWYMGRHSNQLNHLASPHFMTL